VLQSVAECCRVLQSVAECCGVLRSVASVFVYKPNVNEAGVYLNPRP